MAYVTPLHLTDFYFCNFSSNLNLEDIDWLSSSQTLLTNLNFRRAKYFSFVCLPYLFHSKHFITL